MFSPSADRTATAASEEPSMAKRKTGKNTAGAEGARKTRSRKLRDMEAQHGEQVRGSAGKKQTKSPGDFSFLHSYDKSSPVL
jgi:type VI protein secretion system component Hcp